METNAPIQKMMEDAKKDGTVGPLIGSIVIILILIVGGLFFWGSIISQKKDQIELTATEQEQVQQTVVEDITKQSSSDDTASIEADLKATNVDSLDAGLDDIDREY